MLNRTFALNLIALTILTTTTALIPTEAAVVTNDVQPTESKNIVSTDSADKKFDQMVTRYEASTPISTNDLINQYYDLMIANNADNPAQATTSIAYGLGGTSIFGGDGLGGGTYNNWVPTPTDGGNNSLGDGSTFITPPPTGGGDGGEVPSVPAGDGGTPSTQ